MSLRRKYADLRDRYEARIAADETEAEATAAEEYALTHVAAELDRCKEVIASHLIAAGHPSTVLHDVRSFADALQQALTDAGVDLRVHLHRLEGGQL